MLLVTPKRAGISGWVHYSTRRIRDLADKKRGGPHGDLWRGLALVMGKLQNGEVSLGLPALGSWLWGPGSCSWLMASDCGNEFVLSAFRQLSHIEEGRTRYSVNWRNVGADELGSIYEGLLELHPRMNKEAATFGLDTAAGHERKTTGSYYTPTGLVDCLLDAGLDPLLDEACTSADPERAILKLAVCDPACGSGHFLVAAARRVAKRLAGVRSGDDEPSPRDIQAALRDVVGRCIYGVDVNPMAVELCKVSLWMEAIEPGKPLSFLESHIQCGNALLGATEDQMVKGIPDHAFKVLLEGDSPSVAKRLQARNSDERRGQLLMFRDGGHRDSEGVAQFRNRASEIELVADDVISAVHEKEERWRQMSTSPDFKLAWGRADAWCAAFVWPKHEGSEAGALTHGNWVRLINGGWHPESREQGIIDDAGRRYRFFHWELAFPQVLRPMEGLERRGFDLVLGNPPWVRQELLRNEKPLLQNYIAYSSAADSSVYFMELAWRLVRHGGRVALLTPNKWLRSKYAAKIRAVMRDRARVHLLVDFGHSKSLFPGVDTFPAAVIVSKPIANGEQDWCLRFVRAHDEDRVQRSLADIITSDAVDVPRRYLEDGGWRLESDDANRLLEKIRSGGQPLRHVIGSRSLSGIKTGLNEAYYLTAEKYRQIVSAYPDERELFQKFLRGRDIGRWSSSWSGMWHLVIESSQGKQWPWSSAADEEVAEAIFAQRYPGAYGHLLPYRDRLSQRSDRGRFWWELRSCDYYESLAGPKVVVQCIAFHSRFAFDDTGCLVNNKAIAIPTQDPYVMAVLNSRVMWWFMYRVCQHMKDDGISVDVNVVDELPVPEPASNVREAIAEIVRGLMEGGATQARVVEAERNLDGLICTAFSLDARDIEVLEGTLPPRDPIEVACGAKAAR